MDRADPGRVGGRVDEQGQAVVPRPVPLAGLPAACLQLPVGGVPVMPVGDQCLPRRQVGAHGGDLGRVGDGPDPVPYGVLGQRLDQRLPAGRHVLHQPGGGARPAAVVEQEDGLQVRLGGLHQLRAGRVPGLVPRPRAAALPPHRAGPAAARRSARAAGSPALPPARRRTGQEPGPAPGCARPASRAASWPHPGRRCRRCRAHCGAGSGGPRCADRRRSTCPRCRARSRRTVVR